MNKHADRKALGKGLGALLPTRPTTVGAPPAEPVIPVGTVTHLPPDAIEPNPLQPRRVFNQDRLAELAQSIRANGVIQPLVVRQVGDRYQLVAGERRWRASKLAQVEQVPVVVQQIPDEHLLEVTLVENIQREDLNPIETAQAFQRLVKELNLSHEEVGQRTGKDRTTITNLLRLLLLPPDVQNLVAERRISAGHARCLLSLPTAALQLAVAEKATAQGLSVRQLERLTQRMMEGRSPKQPEDVDQDPNVRAAIAEMERSLGTKVRIVEKAKQRGRIEIDYYSSEDVDRIYAAIVGTSN